MAEPVGLASAPRRLEARRLNARAVAWGNTLRREQSWTLDWFGQPAQVRVVHVRWIEEASSMRHDLLVRVQWCGVDGCLGLSHVAAEAAWMPHLGVVLWDALPLPVVVALLQDGVDRLWTNPRLAALGPLRFGTMSDAQAWTGPMLAVEFRATLTDRVDAIGFEWLVDANSFDLDRLPWREGSATSKALSVAQLEQWGQLPIVVAFEMGWVQLPLSELQGLRPGDVLLPDRWWSQEENGLVCLRVEPRSGWRKGHAGRWDETTRQITVTGARTMEQDLPEDMLDTLARGLDGVHVDVPAKRFQRDGAVAPSQEPGEEPVPETPSLSMAQVGELPVRLTFDLGECSLTLHELTSLSPGHVFDLGLSARHGVNLRVNGLRVGEGEIVEIDGRLGVAVSRVLPPRS